MKIKKVLLISLSVIFIAFISLQLFFICTYKGNLHFLICNESLSADSVYHLEIYIDGNKVIDEQLDPYYSYYSDHFIKTTLKNHTAIVKINGYASEEIKFNTILFTSIYVDYYVDELRNNKKRIFFTIQKHPIYFLA
jgi:hypothetical protein